MNTITLAVPAASLSPIRRSYSYMALSPAALFLSVFFALPMGLMIGISFSQEEVGGFSVESYRRFFTDGLSVAGFCRTAVMS
ncbi:ABC transporter permease, partial [Rhizobium ruizarguesonis]